MIWSEGDYDIDIETNDDEWYYCCVKKDLGTELGPPLKTSKAAESSEQAWDELEKELEKELGSLACHVWSERERRAREAVMKSEGSLVRWD